MTSRLQKLLEFHRADPSDAFTRYGIALEYSSAGQFDSAIEWFENLRSDSPDYLPTYYMLGSLYGRLGNPDKARTVLQEGIAVARRANDMHTLSELRAALDDIDDD